MSKLIEIFTLSRVVVFVAGMLVNQFIGWLMNKRRERNGLPPKRSGFTTVVGVVVVIAMVWIMVSTQQARNCALNLNIAVGEEQRISSIERNALIDVFFQATNPPPEIAGLPTDDPARKAWGQKLGAEYFQKVNDAAKQREQNQKNQDAAKQACGV